MRERRPLRYRGLSESRIDRLGAGRAVGGDRPADRTTRLVLISYVALTAAPFVIAATHQSFWKPEHSMAPVATLLVALTVSALVMRRRWAWLLLAALEVAGLVRATVDFPGVLPILVNVASFAMLLSPPMRRYIRLRGRGTSSRPAERAA